MSSFQIYYYMQPQNRRGLERMGIDLDTVIPNGKTPIENIKEQIKKNPKFCRDEKSIKYNYFLNLLSSDIVLYALSEDKIVLGALAFMFNEKNANKIIMFNGICSPSTYAGKRIGEELINMLIRIGKTFDVKYINLDCVGDKIKKYYEKFGFVASENQIIKRSYDSDDDSDEDAEPHYYMKLYLSTITGGKKKLQLTSKFKTNIRTKRNRKTRRKLRK